MIFPSFDNFIHLLYDKTLTKTFCGEIAIILREISTSDHTKLVANILDRLYNLLNKYRGLMQGGIMELGEIIKSYRLRHKMTMSDFAKKSNLSKGYISMIERGNNPTTGKPVTPSLDTIKNVADAMFMDRNVLMEMLGDDVEVKVLDSNLMMIPVYGNERHEGSDSLQDIIDYIPVSGKVLENKNEHFAVRINPDKLDWMFKGDHYAIVKKDAEIAKHDIAIVLIENTRYMIGRINKQEDGIMFIPIGRGHDAQFFLKDKVTSGSVRLIGKVVELRNISRGE